VIVAKEVSEIEAVEPNRFDVKYLVKSSTHDTGTTNYKLAILDIQRVILRLLDEKLFKSSVNHSVGLFSCSA
jgi:hypothetical protein